MVLEEHIVLVRCTTNTAEDVAAHELADIGSEAINDLLRCQLGFGHISCCYTHVMVIPDVDLCNLSIYGREWCLVIPLEIVLEVVVVAFCSQLLRERILSSLLRALDIRPWAKRAVNSNSVVVDLITASDHDMPWSLAVFPHHVVPQRRPAPGLLVGSNTEAVARVEHDPHRLGRGRDEKVVDAWLMVGLVAHLGNLVLEAGLGG